MLTLADIAARVQGTFRPMALDLVYRVLTYFSPRVASSAAIGATTITLGNLPADMTGVLAGDTFGAGAYTFTADTAASGGAISNAPFAPALAAAFASGAVVQVSRQADTPCKGWIEWLDTSRPLTSVLVKQKDAAVTVLADSLPFTPVIGHKMLVGGYPKIIDNIGRDPAGAAWVLKVTG